MLRFIDGFDHYTTAQIPRKWTSTSGQATRDINASEGRNGSGALQLTTNSSTSQAPNIQKVLTAFSTWIIGFAYRYSSLADPRKTICSLLDSGTIQCSLCMEIDGSISITRGTGTILTNGVSVVTLTPNIWYYIELKVTISDSISENGCQVRVNGVTAINVATGQDTKVTANESANTFRFGNSILPTSAGMVQNNWTQYYDDFYILDNTGSINNDFLGDRVVTTLRPNGAGNSSEWAPSTGANWENVDDVTADDDVTYNAAPSAGLIDLYALGNLPVTPQSIAGIQWNGVLRSDDAGTYDLRRILRSGGANYLGSTIHAPNNSYLNYEEIIENDPATSAPWTKSGIDALEAGVKLEALS